MAWFSYLDWLQDSTGIGPKCGLDTQGSEASRKPAAGPFSVAPSRIEWCPASGDSTLSLRWNSQGESRAGNITLGPSKRAICQMDREESVTATKRQVNRARLTWVRHRVAVSYCQLSCTDNASMRGRSHPRAGRAVSMMTSCTTGTAQRAQSQAGTHFEKCTCGSGGPRTSGALAPSHYRKTPCRLLLEVFSFPDLVSPADPRY